LKPSLQIELAIEVERQFRGSGLCKLPNVAKFFRDMPRKIPRSIAQGIRLQAFEFAGLLAVKNVARGPNLAKFPVNFPVT
jgi:hypothetical protein